MRSREALILLCEACSDLRSVSQLHSLLLRTGHTLDSFFATKITSYYARFGSFETARQVFDETPHRCRTVFLWNAFLRACSREKHWKGTLQLFRQMYWTGGNVMPDNFTVSIVLKACSGLSALSKGKAVHGFVKKYVWIDLDMYVGSSLVELYSKCGQMGYAHRMFGGYPQPDVVLWTSVVTGYQQNGNAEIALSLFSQMMMSGVDPDPVTLISVVSASTELRQLGIGRCCHGYIIKRGYEHDLPLDNSLLNFYGKLSHVEVARKLFNRMLNKDVVSWSSMMAGYSQNGNAIEALDLFDEMIEQGLEPNSVTVINGLQACAISFQLDKGRRMHELATTKGFELDVAVSTALVDFYMKCSSLDNAVDVFGRTPQKDVVSWAALISGFALNGFPNESMGTFCSMLSSGVIPDAVTMVKVLVACSQLGVLKQASCLHGYLVSSGFHNQVFIGAALIDLYSKCGSLDSAVRVFLRIDGKDVVIWSSMIAAYGFHGHGNEAIWAFDQMVASSLKPNDVTFISILSACSHAGLIEEGIRFFYRMVEPYAIMPNEEHYCIMVDLFGRKGQLEKAVELIHEMPIPASSHVWGALLSACQIHSNVQLGELAAKKLFDMDPKHGGYYVLLSNLYAGEAKWDKVADVRRLMKEKQVVRAPGCSSIEVRNIVNIFTADDCFHPEFERIYRLLRELEVKVREEGFFLGTTLMWNDFSSHSTDFNQENSKIYC